MYNLSTNELFHILMKWKPSSKPIQRLWGALATRYYYKVHELNENDNGNYQKIQELSKEYSLQIPDNEILSGLKHLQEKGYKI